MSDIYNDLELLTVTFKSDHIINSTLSNISDRYKITIVENSNNDQFKKNVEKRKNVNCILANKNLGFGKSFNLGAKSIHSKYILHFNPDALINDHVIEKLYEYTKSYDFGIISALQTDLETNIIHENDNLVEVESVKGFVMFCNNSALREVNYFDENFFLYLEEIDLCKRLKELNKKIFVSENIKVKHLGGKSHNPKYDELMEMQRNWHYMWSLFYFTKKHKNSFYAYKITIRRFISAFLKSLFYYFYNQKKYKIYKYRYLGLLNSYLGNKSFFRIDLD